MKQLDVVVWNWEKEDMHQKLITDRVTIVDQLREGLTATLNIKVPFEVASAMITKADSIRRFLAPFDSTVEK